MQIYAEAESNASLVAIAEAIQYIWRQPNNAEAESNATESNASVVAIAEAIQYMWRQPNNAEAESNASVVAIAEAIQYMWRQHLCGVIGQNVQADCQIPQGESDDSA